eukprot:8717408-Pyramimonas_sp.AAC.1
MIGSTGALAILVLPLNAPRPVQARSMAASPPIRWAGAMQLRLWAFVKRFMGALSNLSPAGW